MSLAAGTVHELTWDTFQDAVADSNVTVIEFTAAWCGPCQWFVPVFEEAARKHEDVLFARVDIESEDVLARTFQIASIPTVAVIHDRAIVFQHPGALPATALEDVLEQALALEQR